MLYLSQLLVSGRSREARGDLSDCRALHQRILSAFPDAPDVAAARERYGVLYRAETVEGGARILVQSRERPNWTCLPAGYLVTPVTEPKQVGERYTEIVMGQELVFRLRANPTKRIDKRNMRESEHWRGKRVEVRGESELLNWLRHKGTLSGFELITARTQRDSGGAASDVRIANAADKLTGIRSGQKLTFSSVVFEGRLRVTDVNRFLRTLEVGVGSGKAFGFGLLSIAPSSMDRD